MLGEHQGGSRQVQGESPSCVCSLYLYHRHFTNGQLRGCWERGAVHAAQLPSPHSQGPGSPGERSYWGAEGLWARVRRAFRHSWQASPLLFRGPTQHISYPWRLQRTGCSTAVLPAALPRASWQTLYHAQGRCQREWAASSEWPLDTEQGFLARDLVLMG